ncbi:MAG: flavodoxin [Anaeroplasmataceae bacterium]|nr:flavodoxin [Anaeroplasmataceae bacterium]
MKKLISILGTALCFLFLLASCGKEAEVPPIVPDENRPTFEDATTLVIYFSQPDNVDNSSVVIEGEILGNTQYMAYVIQENTNADIFRILPEIPYPTDHSTLVDLASEEKSQGARPAIKDTIKNFEKYDVIFVGYPNWWGDMPMILYTLFDTYDFSNKVIIPFNTHGGSGFSNTISTIKRLEPLAEVKDGKSISRNHIQDAEQEIIDWVVQLGFKK